jgi:hypothetical protein
VFYAYMVYTCHSGETALLGPFETATAVWEKKVRRWRFVVIGLGLFLSLGAYGASLYGFCHDHSAPTHAKP